MEEQPVLSQKEIDDQKVAQHMQKLWEEIDQSKSVIDDLKTYVREEFNFIVISGGVGTGKTFAAIKLGKILCQYCVPGGEMHCFYDDRNFVNVSELNMTWLAMMSERHNCYDLYSKLVSKDVLILDDLGTRRPSEAFCDFLYSVINKRYGMKMRTIITTNLSAKELRESLGEPIFSRIASEMTIRIDGDDRRFKKKNISNKFYQ